MIIGKKIKMQRVSKGMSQSDLANCVGITQQTLQRLESGKAKTSRHIDKIASALGVDVDYLSEEDAVYEPTAPFPLFSWDNFIKEKKLFDTKDIVPTEYFYFDKKYTKYKDAFVVKIPQHVPAPYMFDNAYILFSKEVPFSHNGLMLVQYGTELALKRLVKEGNTAFLKSFSADIPVEPVTKDTKILGQLIASQISADEFKG
ncbi:MAG: hypothetical protein CMF49_06205 [Legionellales bacterium]|nr:hypothetical protein [Legionellales bacterium]|tara:strand:- start:141 stop:746 length:606 start_codon:yes stop_codon:yes gene_type:complete